MANFNRQTDNRKAKRRRRRAAFVRTVAKLEAENSGAEKSQDLARTIRTLRRTMRVNG